MFQRLDSRADVLTQVLDAVHLGSVLSSRSVLRSPWAIHYGRTEHRAGFHVVAAGRCWVVLDPPDGRARDGATEPNAADPIALGPGDLVVFPHGTGHTLADDPATPAVELESCVAGLGPGERVVLPNGTGKPDSLGSGEVTTVLCGSYAFSADGAHPLLRGLPPMLHLAADQTRGGPLEAAVRLLTAEAGRPDAGSAPSGSALVVDRLVDLLFVYALRTWLERHDEARARSWFGALQDPAVGPAVRAVHDDPAHPWTVEALARRAGLSRAAFARRFQRAVGEPPLAYVTRWRMTMAADLLAQGEYIAAVAHGVGYENEFAFAKAFKRVRGVSPGQVRRRHHAPSAAAPSSARAS